MHVHVLKTAHVQRAQHAQKEVEAELADVQFLLGLEPRAVHDPGDAAASPLLHPLLRSLRSTLAVEQPASQFSERRLGIPDVTRVEIRV